MGDAQKAFNQQAPEIGNGDKVQIPYTFEESDSESETLCDRLRKINAYGDSGQGCSKDMEGEANK